MGQSQIYYATSNQKRPKGMGPFAFTSSKAIQQKMISEQESLSKAIGGLVSTEIHYSTSSNEEFNQRSDKELDVWEL